MGTATQISMATTIPTDPSILTLAQWFSPAFPVGAFHFSHGLAAAIDQGQVTNPVMLRSWINTVLEQGTGRCDALFLAASYHATPKERLDIDAQCLAFAPSKERKTETRDMGRAFVRIIGAMEGFDEDLSSAPVVIGAAAQAKGLPLDLTIQFYLQSFVSNLVSVGQRTIPIGQTDAQKMIASFVPQITQLAQDTMVGDLTTLSATAFLTDIASMQHETQYSRMFKT